MRVAVLGGGISGLAAAWSLAPVGRVVLYEASNRIGGWMRTDTTSNGAVFELGPRSLRTAGESARATMNLVSELGLQDQVLPVLPTNTAAKRRLIYTDKAGLVQLPSGLSWLFRAKPPFSKPLLGAVLKEIFTKPANEEETVFDFFQRRTGPELTQFLIDPLCRGVYASSAQTLSMRACFPQLVAHEQEHGSLVRGMVLNRSSKSEALNSLLADKAKQEKWSVYTFRNGLQTLPDTLLHKLLEKGVDVRLGQPCTKLELSDDRTKVTAPNGEEVFDHVVSTLPANALAQLLPDQPQLSELLSSIPFVTVGVVCLEYEGEDIIPQEYRQAFGYLVPSTESSRILGVVFDSASFPSQSRRDVPSTRLTVMMGGEWFREALGDPALVDKSVLAQTALNELHNQLGITAQPSYINANVLHDGIAQYVIGHTAKLESIDKLLLGLPLSLCGSSYRGVSVNDCVYNAITTSNKIVNSITRK